MVPGEPRGLITAESYRGNAQYSCPEITRLKPPAAEMGDRDRLEALGGHLQSKA